jgi:hypothetical protein
MTARLTGSAMSLRKFLLRLMLVSLAFSALAGASAVLMAGQDVVWRVVGTGMIAAVGSGLMLVLSLLMDKERSRAAGLLGMVTVVAAFLIGLLLIWDLKFIFHGDWAIALTLLLILGAAPPAMLFLRIMYADGGKWAGIVGLTGCAIGFALLLGAIWYGDISGRYGSIAEDLASSAWVVSLFGALAAGSLAGLGVNVRWWRWIGVVASAAAAIMALVGIWEHLQNGGAAFAAVTGVAVIVAHANLAYLCKLTAGQQWIRWGTVAAVIVTSLLLDVVVFQDYQGGGSDYVARSAGAAAIAAGCGTLALLILARLNRKISTRTLPTGVKELTLVCPWCQRKQALPLGSSSCGGCGLKFRIAIEEPRCPNCDYLLYMLNSDRCPECGTLIKAGAEAAQVSPG